MLVAPRAKSHPYSDQGQCFERNIGPDSKCSHTDILPGRLPHPTHTEGYLRLCGGCACGSGWWWCREEGEEEERSNYTSKLKALP